MWKSDAAVAELFLPGNIATIAKEKPKNVIPYRILIVSIKVTFDWGNIYNDAVSTSNVDIPTTIKLKKRNQPMKYVSSRNPIIFIPSLPLLSFSSAILVTM